MDPKGISIQLQQSDINIHDECRRQYRSYIIRKYIGRHPDALAKTDVRGYMLLHCFLENKASSIEDALMMMDKFPAALQHPNKDRHLPLHIECKNRCRSAIIAKCIELYPEALSKADYNWFLPMHTLANNAFSTIEAALMMIEKYPAALQHRNKHGNLPLHIECRKNCRAAFISKCIDIYPAIVYEVDECNYLPIHRLLWNASSTVEGALMLTERYPALLQRQDKHGDLPIHIECKKQCRSAIIAKCIQLYSESLTVVGWKGNLPLHGLLNNKSSSISDALMLIEKYPAALQHHQSVQHYLPLHVECSQQCRSVIISKCIEIYPEAVDDDVIAITLKHVNKYNYELYLPALVVFFAALPMKLYQYRYSAVEYDIRDDLYYRRRILNLLPRHVFTPTHEADYRNRNWHPRSSVMMLLSRMKIKIQ
jgi:ankyrin repeat protein